MCLQTPCGQAHRLFQTEQHSRHRPKTTARIRNTAHALCWRRIRRRHWTDGVYRPLRSAATGRNCNNQSRSNKIMKPHNANNPTCLMQAIKMRYALRPKHIYNFAKMLFNFCKVANYDWPTLSCVFVSKSDASWRSCNCIAGSPCSRLTIRPRRTASRASICSAQRITFL
jgi:hypothetical protein